MEKEVQRITYDVTISFKDGKELRLRGEHEPDDAEMSKSMADAGYSEADVAMIMVTVIVEYK